LTAPTLQAADDVCPEVRFSQQPSVAVCTALLLDERTVLTAGHCARALPCEELRFVFGYQLTDGRVPTQLDSTDVYGCASVIARKLSVAGAAERVDYAWVQLDRAAPERVVPIELRAADAPLRAGEPISVIGYGSGLPLKVGTGGTISDPRPQTLDFFLSSSDTFHGDSGAPVFDAKHRLIGIQVRGNADYVTTERGCNNIAQLPPSQAAEESSYVARALTGLCATSPGHALCCRAPSCRAHASASTGGCAASPGVTPSPRSLALALFVSCIGLLRRRLCFGSRC
jgi:V8-like Glu-specific endopeptidase